jgi:hypothetical protein
MSDPARDNGAKKRKKRPAAEGASRKQRQQQRQPRSVPPPKIAGKLLKWIKLQNPRLLTDQRIRKQAMHINEELGNGGVGKYPSLACTDSWIRSFLERYNIDRTIPDVGLEIIEPDPESLDELQMRDVILPLLDEVLQSPLIIAMIEEAGRSKDTSVARIASGR